MTRTVGTTKLTDAQADEMLERYGQRYVAVESGESAYQRFPRDRKFGRGRMAASIKTRGR